jgi:hypothetical protein
VAHAVGGLGALVSCNHQHEKRKVMHRKHYNAIVTIINEFTGDGNAPGTMFAHQKFDAMIEQLARMFEQDNPNFSRQRFFDAVKEYDNEL